MPRYVAKDNIKEVNLLTEYRIKHKITREDMADRMGIHWQTLRNYEYRLISNPSKKVFDLICKHYKVTQKQLEQHFNL